MTHRYQLYIKSIEDRVLQLEYNNFSKEDFEGFKCVMQTETKHLTRNSPQFENKPANLHFLGLQMRLIVLSSNDEWSYRVEARMRTLAVSLNLVPRLQWEV